MSDLVVALDVGKTNLRAEVRERGSCRLRVGEAVRGWMGAPGPRAALLAHLAEVCGRLPDARSVTSVGAGIAGYDSAADEEKAEVSRALQMALPGARVRVASDARTAHLGAFRGRAGALLVAGTGAVALAVDPAGASHWAGGLGPVLGDEGSGGWIGREGCLAAARSIDGRGPPTGLAQRCERTFGVPATQLGALLAVSPSPAACSAASHPACSKRGWTATSRRAASPSTRQRTWRRPRSPCCAGSTLRTASSRWQAG